MKFMGLENNKNIFYFYFKHISHSTQINNFYKKVNKIKHSFWHINTIFVL